MKIDKKAVIFYIALFLFITVVSFQANLADYDLFARLLQGQAFWSLGNILHQDIFSYTPTHTWYDHEWGSSVIFYWVFSKFGGLGLLILKSLLIFGIFFFAIQALKVRGVKFTTPYNFIFFFFAYHAAAQAGYSNTIRCQLISYLFFTLWLWLLEKIRTEKKYYLLAYFVPMMLLWANIHGGCAAGLGLIILYAIGEALNKKPFKYYIFTAIGCGLITFANPWGAGYVKFLAMATTMPRILIGEWQGTFSSQNHDSFMIFKVFLAVMLLTALIRLIMKLKAKTLKNTDWTKAAVMLAMTYLSIRYTRHQPFFVICAIVFLYDDFYRILGILTPKFLKNNEKLIHIKDILICIFVALATIGYFATQKPQVVINNNAYPIKAVEFVKTNNLKGNLLVDFQEGSYAAYKLYPQNLIAMDGRYEEVYHDYMLPMFNNFFMQVGENPNMLIETFRPDIIIVSHRFEAEKALIKNKTYKKVYEDESYSVFLDKKFSKSKYKEPSADLQFYNDTLFESSLKFTKLRQTSKKH